MAKTYYVVRTRTCYECGRLYDVVIEKVEWTDEQLLEEIDGEGDWKDRIHESLDDAKTRVLDLFDDHVRRSRQRIGVFFGRADGELTEHGYSNVFL